MAFQIKDDQLDFNDKVQNFKSYAKLLGPEKTQDELKKHSDLAKQHLIRLNQNTDILIELVNFNLIRNF